MRFPFHRLLKFNKIHITGFTEGISEILKRFLLLLTFLERRWNSIFFSHRSKQQNSLLKKHAENDFL